MDCFDQRIPNLETEESMTDRKHFVIFSHGFGVRQDARGMFTDIVACLPSVESILFDYNTFDDRLRTVMVPPLSDQAKLLESRVRALREAYPESIIDIIGHSQGAVVMGLAQLETLHIRKALLLAPPASMGFERILDRFRSRPGTVIDLNGMTRLARRDGSFTLLSARYFEERVGMEPLKLYAGLSGYTETVIIQAAQDEVLGSTDFSSLKRARTVVLEADHDFTGAARERLIEVIQKEIL